MKILLRRALHKDAKSIVEVHLESIRNVCFKDYTPRQIDAWTNGNKRHDLWCQAMDRDYIWVIEANGKVLGFGHFAVLSEFLGEVLGLYFAPSIIGLGFGKKMIQEMIAVAQSQQIQQITLHSTITAKKFYESCGFFQSGSDDSIEMRGVDIPCMPMQYQVYSQEVAEK